MGRAIPTWFPEKTRVPRVLRSTGIRVVVTQLDGSFCMVGPRCGLPHWAVVVSVTGHKRCACDSFSGYAAKGRIQAHPRSGVLVGGHRAVVCMGRCTGLLKRVRDPHGMRFGWAKRDSSLAIVWQKRLGAALWSCWTIAQNNGAPAPRY